MADGLDGPCWCVAMPPVVAVPPGGAGAACWCPDCLNAHIAAQAAPVSPAPLPETAPTDHH